MAATHRAGASRPRSASREFPAHPLDVVVDLGAGSLLGERPVRDPDGTERGLRALLSLSRRTLEKASSGDQDSAARLEQPTSAVQETIDVAVPVATAYGQWTQFESFPHFMGGVESVVQQDDTHLHWTTKVAGQTREFDTVITEQNPDDRIAWKSIDGPNHAGVVTFRRLNDAESRVSVQFDWEPGSATEKIGAAFGADNAQVKSDLKRFKDFVESHGATGGWRGSVNKSSPQAEGAEQGKQDPPVVQGSSRHR